MGGLTLEIERARNTGPKEFPVSLAIHLDTDGAIRWVEPDALDQLGMGADADPAGESFLSWWAEPDVRCVAEALDKVRHDGKATFEARMNPDFMSGRRIWSVQMGALHADGGTTHILAVLVDVTRKVARIAELEEELKHAHASNAQLVRRLETKRERIRILENRNSQSDKLQTMGAFVASVVHDMNNVLSVMKSAQRIVTRKLKGSVETDLFAEVDASIDRGQSLLRQLLDFSRTDDLHAELADPAAMLDRDKGLIQQLIGRSGLQLELPDERWQIFCEPGRFAAVVFNIVSNAHDAIVDSGRPGTVTVAVRNVPRADCPTGVFPRDYVCVSIRDTGKGMVPEVLSRMGEPFFTTKPKGKGTGIGIRSAYDLARRCGGKLDIDSAPDTGTEIRIYLARAELRGEVIGSEGGIADRTLHGDARVLILANPENLGPGLQDLMTGLGYDTALATDILEARELVVDELIYDLLIVDLDHVADVAPSVLDALCEYIPGSKCIRISSFPSTPDVPVHLNKPISEYALSTTMLDHLDRLPGASLTGHSLRQSALVRERLPSPEFQRVFDIWHKKAQHERHLPDGSLVHDLQIQMPGNACLISCDPSPEEDGQHQFRFVWAGSALEARLGYGATGARLTDAHERLIGPIAQLYRRCQRGTALYSSARVLSLSDQHPVNVHRLLLPLAEGGERVTHLFGLVHFHDVSG
ncbi:sensory box histidine kinase/response regulator [Sagittula stellata E-37]|uniref:histidine kinase n=2 Tax=Sagittula stellata TaxID=52603 RepID=A3K0U1_SAGS3|nr:sensory box histidine kinase/response regulator [Sagittula stellata E-37]